VADALRVLRKLDPAGRYDFHHVLTHGGPVDGTSVTSPAQGTPTVAGPIGVRVGLIDGGVATTHAVFAGIEIVTHGCGDRSVPSAHGTAVASLLAETLGARPRQPDGKVQLLAADVYCGDTAGGSIERVINSLAWLSQGQVPVINVSLVGPHNRLLERAVMRVIERGHAVVAAVGNDGPAAPPLYPAAYEGVIGVSGIDRRGRALLEACRGPHVDFAALGADLRAAAIPQGRADVRGTSYAAPQVAAMLALQMPRMDPNALPAAVEVLARGATDLGARGRDSVYGFGWVVVPTTMTEPAPLMSNDED
jgi:subtilisin family serine protease